jgi:ammonium transporter Rh
VQNATLAGGVAIGASCDLEIRPAGALTIGLTAGIISTFGFNKIQGFLERKLGIQVCLLLVGQSFKFMISLKLLC